MSILFSVDDSVNIDGVLNDIATATTGAILISSKISSNSGNQELVFGISRDSAAPASLTELVIFYDMRDGADNNQPDKLNVWLQQDGNLQWGWASDANFLDAKVGEWLQIVVTHNGITPTIYCDGAVCSGSLYDTTNASKWFRAILTDATFVADTANIGILKRAGVDIIPFDGQLNEVAVWDTNISSGEVSILNSSKMKHMPLQIKPANLKGYWAMNSGADGASADGATIIDLSGNGNNGTGDDGANNTGLTWKAEEALSYPSYLAFVTEANQFPIVDAGIDKYVFHYRLGIPLSDATFSDNDGTVDHAYIDVNGGGFTEIPQGDFATLQDAVQAYVVKFPNLGAITVTLKVEDNGGATSQDTMTMNVLTVTADDVIEINGIKYDVLDGVNWDREGHHLKIPVVKRV